MFTNILEECATSILRTTACLAYSSTLRVDVVHSSKTLVNIEQNAWHNIPEDSTLHSHCIKNLKTHAVEK
jgi:hypothetical protein